MRKAVIAAALAFSTAIGTAAIAEAKAPGQQGYEGQPGNQGNGQNGYEGQPGNQGGHNNNNNNNNNGGQQGYEGQPGNQGGR